MRFIALLEIADLLGREPHVERCDVIVEMGLLREDGKTLIGQPHLNLEKMWTIDDIRAIGWELKYPLAEDKPYEYSYA